MGLDPKEFVMRSTFIRSSATVLGLTAVTMLGACGRDQGRDDLRSDSRGAGQKTEAALGTTANKASEVAAEIRQGAGNAADVIGSKAKDLAITTEVKTRLARDSQLSALAINVDTNEGRVVLRGTAPDTAARTQATELARSVDGVQGVDNVLTVQARNN